MTRETLLRSFSAGALCATFVISACRSTRNDEPKAADKKPESVPAAAPAAVTLHVGDAAPSFSFEQWIQGAEIHGLEAGKVNVVEFWATWCGPCVASIPHLNELQQAHPDVVFLGLAGSEKPPEEGKADTRVEDLRAFIAKQGDKMTYRVAYDADRSMTTSWMKPAGQKGIPCAFIIGRDGHIAWIGHPSQMEAPLTEALKAK